MQNKTYGYIRVSTKEQNEERQRVAMREAGVPENHIYMDKQSGKDFDRPQYKKMVNLTTKQQHSQVNSTMSGLTKNNHNRHNTI